MKYYIAVTAIFVVVYFGRYFISAFHKSESETGDVKVVVSVIHIAIAIILGLVPSYLIIEDALKLGPDFWTTGRFSRGTIHVISGIMYRGPVVIGAPIALLLTAIFYNTHYYFTKAGRGYTFNGKVYRIERWDTSQLRIYSFLYFAWCRQSRVLPIGSFFIFGTPRLMMHIYQYAWNNLDIISQKKLVQYLRRIGKIKSNDISKFDV